MELDMDVDNVDDALKPPRGEALRVPALDAIDEAIAFGMSETSRGQGTGEYIHLLGLESDDEGDDVTAAGFTVAAAELAAADA